MTTQRRIDFTRAERFGIIRRLAAAMPAKVSIDEGSRTVMIKSAVVVAVLRAIDDHDGTNRHCMASIDTLAAETGISRRQVSRALRWLENSALVAVTRRGRMLTNQIAPVWVNLEAYSQIEATEPPPAEGVNSGNQGKIVNGSLGGVICHSGTSHPRSDLPPVQSDLPPVAYVNCHQWHTKPKRNQRETNPSTTDPAAGGVAVLVLDDHGDDPMQQPDLFTTWKAIELRLAELGAGAPASLAESLSARISIEMAEAIINHFLACRSLNDWTVGALVWRLKNALPGQDPGDGWPSASDAAVRRQDEKRAAEARQEKRRQQRADAVRLATERARDHELENQFGGQLDAITPADRVAMIRRQLGDFAARRLEKNPDCQIMRLELLKMMNKTCVDCDAGREQPADFTAPSGQQ